MTDTKLLFENMTLGNITLDNRIGVAPMARTSATFEGVATNQMVSYYTSFARGGLDLLLRKQFILMINIVKDILIIQVLLMRNKHKHGRKWWNLSIKKGLKYLHK
jgi:hypothetical protein